MYNTWVFMNSASSRHPFICKTFPCGCNTGRFVKKKSIILVHTKLQRNNFPLLNRFFTRFRCVFSHELSRTPHSKLTSAILFVQRPGWPQRFKVQSLKCVSKYKSFYRDKTQNISLLLDVSRKRKTVPYRFRIQGFSKSKALTSGRVNDPWTSFAWLFCFRILNACVITN